MFAGRRKPHSALEKDTGQQIRRVRRCDICGLRARRASRHDYNIWHGYVHTAPQLPTQIAKGPMFNQDPCFGV